MQLESNFAMISVSIVILTSIVVLGFLIYIISKRRVILDNLSQISQYFVFRGPRIAAINAQSQSQRSLASEQSVIRVDLQENPSVVRNDVGTQSPS